MSILQMPHRETISGQSAGELLEGSRWFFDHIRRLSSVHHIAATAIVNLSSNPEEKEKAKEDFVQQANRNLACLSAVLQAAAQCPGGLMVINTEGTHAGYVQGINYDTTADAYSIVVGRNEAGPIAWPLESGSQLFLANEGM